MFCTPRMPLLCFGPEDAALQARREGRSKVIVFNLCGHGHFDLAAYEAYFAGKLQDHELSDAEIKVALAGLDTPTIA